MKAYFGKSPDVLDQKTFALAVRTVKLYKHLTENKREFILSKQAMRAGTNPGAMVRESKNAESLSDFVHKLAIAQKEVNEFSYWIDLLHNGDFLTDDEHASLYKDAEEIYRIVTKSIVTTKAKMTEGKR